MDLYVYPTFLRSGKHHYLVQFNQSNYFGHFISSYREEEVYKFLKQNKKKILS